MADTEDILVERLSSDAVAAPEPARRVLETEISGLQDLCARSTTGLLRL